MKTRIALIAHDKKKDDMIAVAGEYLAFLRGCDQQIGSLLVEGQIDCVIFLRDPMTPQPHEPDINALVRACDVHNIPCATNVTSAHLVLSQLQLRAAQS